MAFSQVITKGDELVELDASDVGKYIRIVHGEHVRIRVLAYGSTIGDEITIEHVCLKSVVFDMCSGAAIRVMNRFYPEIMAIHGVATLKCVAVDEWVLCGALIPKPQWQTAVDEGLGLNYELNPVVSVDWTAALAEIDAALGSLDAPTAPDIVCTVSP